MSQSGKRNAEEAFRGHQAEPQRKRSRRKSRKSTDVPSSGPAENEPATIETTPLQNEVSDKSDSETTALVPHMKYSQADAETKKTSKKHRAQIAAQKTDAAPASAVSETQTGEQKKHSKNSKKKHVSTATQGLEQTDAAEGEGILVRRPDAIGKKSSRSNEKMTWATSDRRGGTFINIDPILTHDNEHVILATRHNIQVYSAKTSLLVRSINVSERGDIRTCMISAASKEHILVGTSNGSLDRYDWTTGRRLLHCKLKLGITHLSSAGVDEKCENFLLITSQNDGRHDLLQLSIDLKSGERVMKTLLQLDYIHSYTAISNDLSTIILFGRDSIHVGRTTQQDSVAFLEQQYAWSSVTAKGRITSCDVRIEEHQAKSKITHVIDVAVALQNGAILVYNNIINMLQTKTATKESVSVMPRRLHWHRTAVRSVKWSRDGNYLISGGDESVLVIWQLDTNQKQFLPHLSTSILNITISYAGAHYAIRLADNSVMVLSTADLSPSTNIVGLSTSSRVSNRATIMHPTEPNRLLSAVSIHIVGAKATNEATHLQAYDIDAGLQISRQALTRNFVSAVNVAPDGHSLQEPNVSMLSVTSDGKWLATMEEWSPDEADVEPLYLKQDQDSRSLECALRIWSWNETDASWSSSIKIENPHGTKGNPVLALAANHTRPEFATIARDGCVKLWTPKTRLRNGLVVKDNAGNALYNWSCTVTSQIESTLDDKADQTSSFGALAYSEDGSVLAAHWPSDTAARYVHLIDTRAGNVVLSQPNLISGDGNVQIRFCGRYLVVLSSILTILDTITLQVALNLVLDSRYTLTKDNKSTQPQLAVNSLTNVVAVSVSFIEHRKPKSTVSIFDLNGTEFGPKTEVNIAGQVQALLADSAGKGFVAIDTEGGVRRLVPHGSTASAPSGQELMALRADFAVAERSSGGGQKGIEDIFGEHASRSVDRHQSLLLEAEPQASARTLDDLLHSSAASSRLGVNDLFERVAQAVSGVRIVT